MAMQTGRGFQYVTALLGGIVPRGATAYGRRHDAPPLEFGQI